MSDKLKAFTKDIADAIREQEESTELINPQDFSTRIRNIKTKENLDAELSEQDTLLADLESSVNELPDKLDLSQTTATESDVLEGKEFFNASGEKVTGTYKDMLQARVDAGGCDYLFYKYTGDNVDFIKNLDLSNATSLLYMFGLATELTEIPLFNTQNVTSMVYTFYNCSKLTEIPLFNTQNVTDMEYTFSNCKKLTTIPMLNTQNVTNMSQMLAYCESLINVPQLNTINVDNMSYMFQYCSTLATIPQFNMENVTRMTYMFSNCVELTNVPALNTRKATRMSSLFQKCAKLITVEGLDLISAQSATGMFEGCKNLTNLTLKNIKISLTIGSGTSYGHLLTLDSLLNTIKELWTNTGTSTLTLTMGTANTAKLANIYVKLIPITDEMRAEDEYIDNKAPFEVCESTDEGAMLITEYITTIKNWILA